MWMLFSGLRPGPGLPGEGQGVLPVQELTLLPQVQQEEAQQRGGGGRRRWYWWKQQRRPKKNPSPVWCSIMQIMKNIPNWAMLRNCFSWAKFKTLPNLRSYVCLSVLSEEFWTRWKLGRLLNMNVTLTLRDTNRPDSSFFSMHWLGQANVLLVITWPCNQMGILRTKLIL